MVKSDYCLIKSQNRFINCCSQNAMPPGKRLLVLAQRQLPSHFVLVLLMLIVACPSHIFADDNARSSQSNEATPIVIPASGEWYEAYRLMVIPLSADKA
jgi:hypothetical protein